MKYTLALYFTLFSIAIAHADLTVEIGYKPQNSTNLLLGIMDRVKGDKIREDIFYNGIIGIKILNLDTREVFNLMPDKNMPMKTLLNQSVLTNAIAIDVIKDTGKTEMVNGYEAKLYTYKINSTSYTLWITRDFPNFETIKADLVKRDRLREVTRNGLFHLSTLPGMLLKYRADNMPTNGPPLQFIINEELVDESVFEVPKDYTWQKPIAPVAVSTNAPLVK
jgi:hypothetical protein